MKESKIQSAIIRYIEKNGGYVVKVIRASKGGVADILCCIDGRFVAIEVKTPGTRNNLSELQKANLAMVRQSGGIGISCCSVDEFKVLFAEAVLT